MASWDSLTVVELKKVLTDHGITIPPAARRKAQLIEICDRVFASDKNFVNYQLKRFGKGLVDSDDGGPAEDSGIGLAVNSRRSLVGAAKSSARTEVGTPGSDGEGQLSLQANSSSQRARSSSRSKRSSSRGGGRRSSASLGSVGGSKPPDEGTTEDSVQPVLPVVEATSSAKQAKSPEDEGPSTVGTRPLKVDSLAASHAARIEFLTRRRERLSMPAGTPRGDGDSPKYEDGVEKKQPARRLRQSVAVDNNPTESELTSKSPTCSLLGSTVVKEERNIVSRPAGRHTIGAVGKMEAPSDVAVQRPSGQREAVTTPTRHRQQLPEPFSAVPSQSVPLDPKGQPIMWRISADPVEPPTPRTSLLKRTARVSHEPRNRPDTNRRTEQTVASSVTARTEHVARPPTMRKNKTGESFLSSLRRWVSKLVNRLTEISRLTARILLAGAAVAAVVVAVQFSGILKPIVYCDSPTRIGIRSPTSPVPPDCIPCPDNGHCERGQLECAPKYRKEWYNGMWTCVRDTKSYEAAQRYLYAISDKLGQLEGQRVCGWIVQPVMSRKELALFLRSAVDTSSEAELFNTRLSILFDELLPASLSEFSQPAITADRNRPVGIHTISRMGGYDSEELYQSVVPLKPFTCRAAEVFWGTAIYGLVGSLIFSAVAWWCYSRRMMQRARQVVYEVVFTQTDLTPEGYAVGPKVEDICITVKENEKYRPFQGYLTESRVRDICRELARRGTGIASGCLSFDMVPFYFSTRAIDSLRRREDPDRRKARAKTPPFTESPVRVSRITPGLEDTSPSADVWLPKHETKYI